METIEMVYSIQDSGIGDLRILAHPADSCANVTRSAWIKMTGREYPDRIAIARLFRETFGMDDLNADAQAASAWRVWTNYHMKIA